MKILIVTQYFWPEFFIINALSRNLHEQGCEVTIATGKPNYPDGQVFPGYTEEGVLRENWKGLEIIRIPLRARRHGGAVNLFLNYFSFVLSGIKHLPGLLRDRRFDVTIVFAPSPLTSAIPAIFLKSRTKSHLAIWVQDLWPESLSATGFIKNRFLLAWASLGVRWIYSKADTLLVQSKAFIGPVSKYSELSKVVYYPNSIDDGEIHSSAENELPSELIKHLDENFCVVFAGNIGKAQAVETLIAAAAQLQHLDNFKLVLVGSGSMSDFVTEEVARLGLNNVVAPGRFPISQMEHIFSRASALIVSLRYEEILSYTIPGKVQAYLASGKPIIACMNGEGARVVLESQAGLACAAEDPNQLAETIEKLYSMPADILDEMGKNGRQYFLENFEMTHQAKNLISILASRVSKD
ncbi:glycosyltransferase family 4 protein [Metapseudomonas lalkuanensis]|uniref:Glycosyltransferase family 4 protein n=1 Tax=Metapseudomonas lalkuanensis TaxID=2604832 RepID=A0A5J6QI36_9GAMM|nr:glycosyltransferase family 4 protein [Pseudomonas lalkuanensis]QEY62230.1 glycosyltransferase family 4 protein [Pseudomonas lalkuanensis]